MSSDAKSQAQQKHRVSKSLRSLLTILKLSLIIWTIKKSIQNRRRIASATQIWRFKTSLM